MNDNKIASLPSRAMSLWNSGADKEKFVQVLGAEGEAAFDAFEKQYGCACIPVHVLYGFPLREPTDPVIRAHRGLDGMGLELRKAIKEINRGK